MLQPYELWKALFWALFGAAVRLLYGQLDEAILEANSKLEAVVQVCICCATLARSSTCGLRQVDAL